MRVVRNPYSVRRASPPVFAVYCPRPLLPGFTQKMGVGLHSKTKPSDSQAIRGLRADFSGAIPFASALGAAAGATPPRHRQLILGALYGHPQPELSNLPGSGTFYFALTVDDYRRVGSM